MKSSLFTFTRSQRSGLFFLFLIVVLVQIAYYCVNFTYVKTDPPEKLQWISLQSEIDSLKKEKQNYVAKIYPFNPNFITDFKGYKLGMSVAEIDRLLAFRKTNKYVNSAAEFQYVTKVSDSLLHVIAPYFKFPDWVKNKKSSSYKEFSKSYLKKEKEKVVQMDLNQATQDDLIKVYGIGPALSERILKEKDKLGGFVSMEQLDDVWGLSPEVLENLNKSFKIISIPTLNKVRINEASLKELMKFPYFKYALAKQILTYRSMNGGIRNSEDLAKINDFPVDKIKIIALYLEF